MAHLFTPYPSVSALRSQLLTNPPPTVPPIEDLMSLEEELKNLKNKSVVRGKKAENDLKTLEGLHRKNKEREKEKEKLKPKERVVKVKREATGTPDPHIPTGPSSTQSSVPPGGHGVKALLGSKSVPSKTFPTKTIPGMKSFPGLASGSGSSTKEKLKKDKERSTPVEKEKKKDLKKKKRKREVDDSDVDDTPERHKKAKRSPEPPSHNHKPKIPSKPSNSLIGLHTPHSTPFASFALPRHIQHIPQRPSPAPVPTPGPSHPKQVTDDFSKLKPPPQIAISQFWQSLDPWLRPLREEDVGLLEWDGDEETPFVMPPLGQHYTEIWEDEDNGRYISAGARPSTATPSTASLPKWDPSTLHDTDLTSPDKGHALGPVHERLLSAMLAVPVLADGRPASVSSASKANVAGESKMINPTAVDERIGKLKPFEGEKQPPKVNVQDMQERLMKELRSIGLLGDEEPDYTKCPDDPLAAELRQCQKLLREQIVINKRRRRRLCEIAKSRLARNEFEEHTGALERSVLDKYNHLQRRDMPKQGKKKKKSGGAGGGAHVVPDGPFVPPPHIHPAAWGLERDEDGVLGVDEELDSMIRTRQQFVDVVQPCLDAKEKERPGTMYGSPSESVFKGT